jgi:metal-responsive CopG/Arc/MetJ family transcriptional regulator
MGRKKINIEDKKPTMNIMINEILLSKIDKIAEKDNINRSNLIEQILKDYINKN